MAEVHGILNLIKPLDWTSMEVVRLVKRLTGQRRVGHAGTLDPQATGVLPICLGQATRVMEYLINNHKSYRFVVRLGVATDTYDSEGKIVSDLDASYVSRDDVERSLNAFRGTFLQVPPMYSALKVGGTRLYSLARAGKEVDRKPREVESYSIDITAWNHPDVEIEIECGRGLYVRSLAHDIGVALECGASIKSLTRLTCGPFDIASAATIQDLEDAFQNESWKALVFPIDFPLLKLKAGMVGGDKELAIRQGQGVYIGLSNLMNNQDITLRMYNVRGEFFALMRQDRVRGKWRARKVFSLN